MLKPALLLFLAFVACVGCSTDEKQAATSVPAKKPIVSGEYIYRLHNQVQFRPTVPQAAALPTYPWEALPSGNHPRITKEYFRCKGSNWNPLRAITINGETNRYADCGGGARHSLPLRDGHEFIYPVLLELLNDIQEKTGKRVVVTCGHRCPEHNRYADTSLNSDYSKHMLGAAVSFYVQGLEERPEQVVNFIFDYYRRSFPGQKAYEEFVRYDKGDSGTALQPWYNKEVFIKIFGPQEGRDFDNRHPYPYINLQVRFDRDLGERVNYSWDAAHNNYFRG